MVYGSKRQIDSDVNAFKSQKDVFDWDMHMLQTAEKNKNAKNRITYAKSLTQKNLYSSNLFDEEKQNHPNQGYLKQSKKQYKGSSDIFNLSHNVPEQAAKNKGIIRLNKNSETVVKDNVIVKPIIKKNTFHQVSEDNTLFKRRGFQSEII